MNPYLTGEADLNLIKSNQLISETLPLSPPIKTKSFRIR